MLKISLVSLLIAGSIVSISPAFASGYGPAPYYKPVVGAPASQRGQSIQTVKAEQAQEDENSSSYGGAADTRSASGQREQGHAAEQYLHH